MAAPAEFAAEMVAALARVASDEEPSAVFRSSLDRRLWAMATHVEGEDLLLCEAASDDYVGRHQHLAAGTLDRLTALGWGATPGDFTRWEPAATDAERAELAGVIWETLVGAFGHDAGRAPEIDVAD
jgi:hypothetical protein